VAVNKPPEPSDDEDMADKPVNSVIKIKPFVVHPLTSIYFSFQQEAKISWSRRAYQIQGERKGKGKKGFQKG